jgi:signal transduction histidine kinase
MGPLRRRFALLLALLAGLSLGPWYGSLRVHDDLDGLTWQMDQAGSLRYRMLDLAIVVGGPAPDLARVQAIVAEQRVVLDRLIGGDSRAGIPSCPEGLVRRRLREHLGRLDEIRALAERAVRDFGRHAEAIRDIRREVREIDDTVHLVGQSGQARVDTIVAVGRIASLLALALVGLVAYGIWDVFSRIRRLERASRSTEPPGLAALMRGPDEVAGLARTLSATTRELARRGAEESRRAERLVGQRRATRAFADDLKEWLTERGDLDGALGRAAAALGFDAIWADEEGKGAPALLGIAGMDASAWQSAMPPAYRIIDRDRALFAGLGHALDLSGHIPDVLRAAGQRTLIVAPLALGGERLGWLGMAARDPEHRPEDVAALVHILAQTLTLTLVARRLLRDRDRHGRLAALLATLPGMREGAASLGAELGRLVPHEVALLCRFGEVGAPDQTWRLADGRAALLDEACRAPMPDEVAVAIDAEVERHELLRAEGLACWLLAPLRAGARAVGALALGRREGGFAAAELDVVGRASPVLASALERLRLQEQLRRAGEEATFGGLGRMVAHEVRNPLNNLILHAHRVERFAARLPPGSEEQRLLAGHAEVLRGELGRLDAMVCGVLELGRGAAAPRERADLRTVVEEVCRVHAPALAEQGVAVSLDLGASPALVEIDRARIVQVMHNLFTNALDAMAHGANKGLWIGLRAQAGTWAVVVRDSGPGVGDPERIFSPGYTTKPLGSGMGLMISRRIAHLHGGQLSARTAPAGGAELALTLPAVQSST